MPELPDIEDYRAALRAKVIGHPLEALRVRSFNLLKTYDPPVSAVEGQTVTDVRRVGKRIVWEFAQAPDPDDAGPLFVVLHLMVAGRLRWKDRGAAIPKKAGLAAFDFPDGTALLTEQGTKHRASLHIVRGEDALADQDRGGAEPLEIDVTTFASILRERNRTLKRGLTDPRNLSGIGNAYSDEILHRAGMSPVTRTQSLDDDGMQRLFDATRETLIEWTAKLRSETGDGFPDKVTAFRDDFAAHGKFGKPCPVCGTEIQRIRYASNETNYCPRCQTDGRILADRSLSRLLKDDWPATIDELEGA